MILVKWTSATRLEIWINGVRVATYAARDLGAMQELHNVCRLLARTAELLNLNHREERELS
jgi:hypothetical protein